MGYILSYWVIKKQSSNSEVFLPHPLHTVYSQSIEHRVEYDRGHGKHIYLLNTVISQTIEYRVEYYRSHGKKVTAREYYQKLMLVWMGVELQEMEIDWGSFEHVLTLNIVEMFIKMFRMLIGAQQMKKIKLTPTRMMLALLIRAIFLIIRILVSGAFVRMFGNDLQTL